jgi:hypothetical protein
VKVGEGDGDGDGPGLSAQTMTADPVFGFPGEGSPPQLVLLKVKSQIIVEPQQWLET